MFRGVAGCQTNTFKELMDYKPSKYRGGEKALECLNWIMKMEQTFRSGDFTDHQKVNYDVMIFEDETLQ